MHLRARVICVALVALTGCSYIFIDRPPRKLRKSDTYPSCTRDNKWPLVDIVGAAGSVLGSGLIYAGVVQANDKNDDGMMTKRDMTTEERIFGGTLALIEGVTFALSAKYGYGATATCRDMQAKYPPPPPPQYPYPPYGYPPPAGYPQPQPYPQPSAPAGTP